MNLSKWCAAALAVLACGAPAARAADDRTVSFDRDWRFHLGDAPGSDDPKADDHGWRTLDVPHDYMIEGVPGADPKAMDGPFDRKSPGGDGNGYLDGGVGWYRKHFASPPAGKHVEVQFDGVYMDAHVWLNGVDLGTHPYGYTSFAMDLTPHLKPDGDNVLAVRCNVEQPCSRFYSGAGIYRHVWLTVTDPVRVDHWGTYVTAEVKGGTAAVTTRTRIANGGAAAVDVSVDTSLAGPDGRFVGHNATAPASVPPGGTADVVQTFDVATPVLWSTTSPKLYHTTAALRVAGKVVDRVPTAFGIRTIEFTADRGFLLNGQHVDIRGVCDHHDLGVLGAAVNTRAIERQIEILKSFGCNAIRTSHYPPTPELLDLCDRMGMLVMDEAFDEWKWGKTKMGYGRFWDDWHERDLVSMLHRDRNHPSIVLWSIGNEIPEQGDKTPHGAAMAKELSDVVHREDPTRPVTSALNQPAKAESTGFAKAVDVFGVNYNAGFYGNDKVHGHWPMIGSETSSTVSTRGSYGLELAKDGTVQPRKEFDHQVTGYDTYVPGWATHVEKALMAMKADPWMAGEFVWTGFDYIGEPTPYHWPSRSSYFGIVDLCGFPKDRYFMYQSQWTERPMVHLLPHWNWEQFAGKAIPVWAYTNADAVELTLNGKSLGTGTRKDLHVEWSVPWAAGELKAVAKRGGQVVATDVVRTAGPPAKLVLTADRSKLAAGRRDLSFVTVSVVDSGGHPCPTAGNEVDFTVTGPATIAGLGDGDATNHEPFQGRRHRVFNGLGLVVLQAGHDAGPVELKAVAEGLESTAVTVTVDKE